MTEVQSNGRRELTVRQRMNLNTLALQSDLRDQVKGEVRFDAGTRAVYAHDSSNYRQVPFGVVIPEDAEDVISTIKVCNKHDAPVLPRRRHEPLWRDDQCGRHRGLLQVHASHRGG